MGELNEDISENQLYIPRRHQQLIGNHYSSKRNISKLLILKRQAPQLDIDFGTLT